MRAHQIMTQQVITVGADTPIVEAADTMLRHHISGLPVVDASGKLIGIVSEGDFIRRAEIGTEAKRGRWLKFLFGTGRIAAAIRRILVTAGIGDVSGGIDPESQPSRPDPTTATRGSIARTRPRPSRKTGARPPARPPTVGPPLPDLAVLIGQPDPELSTALMSDRTPHLVASASEAIGVVGPLIVPGRTACLRCLDLHRTDRDPAWPLILAQLAGRQPIPLACDAPLAVAVAAQAASQALAFVDSAAAPDAVANGTLELVLPGWQWRRRTWPPHERCSCRTSDPR